jgi:hypothetical protein
LKDLAVEDVGIFYGRLVYLRAIRNFVAIGIFSRFGMLYQKNLATLISIRLNAYMEIISMIIRA